MRDDTIKINRQIFEFFYLLQIQKLNLQPFHQQLFRQQLGFRCVRRTNNEACVERNRLHAVNTYGVIVKRFEEYREDLIILFFYAVKWGSFFSVYLHF